MPVLPEVGSTIVPPGLSLPERSASSTIDSAMRSLIEPPGLARSCLIQTSAFGAEQPVDPDMRRVADRLEDIGGLHALVLLYGAARKSGASKLFARRSSGNHHDHSNDHRDRADAARDHRGDRPDQRAKETGLRLAKLVGGGNEERRHCADAAAHRVRRVKLDQRLADVDREHVGRAQQCEADERQRHPARQAENDRRGAEHADRDQHLHADIVLQRPERKESGGQGRPECGRGAQMAEPLRARQWSTSRAKTGSIAVAPPSSTANRSRLIAPSTSRFCRT